MLHVVVCHASFQVGQAEVIRLLADWGVDLEETDSIRKGRPLMHAANNGHTAAVKALVECGADTEAQDENGYTALMVAVFSDRWVVVRGGGWCSATGERVLGKAWGGERRSLGR
jgi:hypothetical protein